jgi:hypothetical protein
MEVTPLAIFPTLRNSLTPVEERKLISKETERKTEREGEMCSDF